ncbi:ubiquinone biosynthesis protein [Pseudoduganella sp. R-34]|uniref:ubiquinone biosynthesis protein n=1 Tax=Pseudoduganella sp. R-34 TaxID=3404062 RepID=UPI003CF0AB09
MSTWQILASFPTAIPSVLLIILLVYWTLSLVGVLDLGENIEGDADHADLETLAFWLVALGLGGVPFSIVATLLVFFTWLPTALLHEYVLAWLPAGVLQWVGGAVILLAAAGFSVWLSARVVKPLRALFVKHHAPENRSLVGHTCRIVTLSVDEKFGRAEVESSGASLNIRVWASSPNSLGKDALAVIVAYDEALQQYEVQAASAAN